jgi:hypothetical protein
MLHTWHTWSFGEATKEKKEPTYKKKTHTHTHTHTFLQIPTHLVMPMWVFELFRWPGQISFQNSGQKKNFVDWGTRLTGQCCRHMTAASWKQKKKLPLDLWSIIYYQGCHQLNSKKDHDSSHWPSQTIRTQFYLIKTQLLLLLMAVRVDLHEKQQNQRRW